MGLTFVKIILFQTYLWRSCDCSLLQTQEIILQLINCFILYKTKTSLFFAIKHSKILQSFKLILQIVWECHLKNAYTFLVTNSLVQSSTNTRWRHREQIFGAQLRKFTFKHRGVFWTLWNPLYCQPGGESSPQRPGSLVLLYFCLLFCYFSCILLYRASILRVPVNRNEEAALFTVVSVHRSSVGHQVTVTSQPSTSLEDHRLQRGPIVEATY